MSKKNDFYHILKQALDTEMPTAVATLIASDAPQKMAVGAKMLIFKDGRFEGGLGNSELDKTIVQDAEACLDREKSTTVAYHLETAGKVEVYIDPVLPPPPLLIFGADPDALPIVQLGRQLGYKIVLVDHRQSAANVRNFPQADELIVAEAEDLAQNVVFSDKTFVLIKTHNYLKDKAILKTSLKSLARYVGQMGPKERTRDLLKELEEEGMEFTQNELQKLHAPVGLDLGAESPEEIALSILSEILAVKNGRAGGFLKNQTDAIHPVD